MSSQDGRQILEEIVSNESKKEDQGYKLQYNKLICNLFFSDQFHGRSFHANYSVHTNKEAAKNNLRAITEAQA